MDEAVISRSEVERRLRDRRLSPRWRGKPPPAFRGLAVDSRAVEPGVLFCAVRGTRNDGHAYLAEAAARGAGAAVVEQEPREPPLPLLAVQDSRSALAHLSSLFERDPAVGLTLAGITGTNGKTTTAWILRHVLGFREPTAAIGTLGVLEPDGASSPGALTTPDPLTLMGTIGRLREKGASSVVLEVSSHALEQRRVDALRFRAAVYTNLSREHLDYHGDMHAYRNAKLRLLELLEEGGVCVVNAEDPAWQGLERDVGSRGGRLLRYAAFPGVEVSARDPRISVDSSSWWLAFEDEEAPVTLPLPGEFNVQNALAAAGAALGLGLPVDEVAARLGTVPPVPGRMEVLAPHPFLVVRDYAHTPDSFRRVLTELRRRAEGRLIVVFGCGGERDVGKRPIMGRLATDLADLALITTDNPRSEDPEKIATQIAAHVAPGRYEIVLDREKAIERALGLAGNGDVVALLGKGHETYQIVGGEVLPFDERKIVERLVAVERAREA